MSLPPASQLDHRRRAVAKLEENVARIAAGGKQEAQLHQQIAKRDAMESAYVAQVRVEAWVGSKGAVIPLATCSLNMVTTHGESFTAYSIN